MHNKRIKSDSVSGRDFLQKNTQKYAPTYSTVYAGVMLPEH